MDLKELGDLLAYHSKRCPRCGSRHATSTHDTPMEHECLACGLVFSEDDALPSQAALDDAPREAEEE